MKALLLFLVLFLGCAFLFGSEEIKSYQDNAAISKSPGFAPAIVDGVTKTTVDKSTSYRVRYKYQVNGVDYRVSTTATDEKGVAYYLSQVEPKVAYDTKNPSVGELKHYYDVRNPNETLDRVLILVGIVSLAISLPLSLALSWRFGWLSRGKS